MVGGTSGAPVHSSYLPRFSRHNGAFKMSYTRSYVKTVEVATNTGTATFTFPNISGIRIRTIAIDAPAAAAYDWVLRDGEGFGVTGEVGAAVDETYYVDLPLGGSGSTATGVVTFVNASNGTYVVKIWAEYN